MLCIFVVHQEEQYLLATFPQEHPAYAGRVPGLVLHLARWQDANQLIVRPRLINHLFLNASLLPMAVPVIGIKALMRDNPALPAVTARGLVARACLAPYHPPIAVCPGGSRCSPFAC